MYGKETGSNKGLAGSQDISSSKDNFYSGAILTGSLGIAVGTAVANGVGVAVGVTEKLSQKYDAVEFVKVSSEIIGGKGGGGRKDFAQAGGQDSSKIDKAFEKIKSLV